MKFNRKPLPLTPPSLSNSSSTGGLLGCVVALFYAVFTLLPDSNTLVVSWPWVFLWQVGLACPVLWLLWLLWRDQVKALGHGLDAIAIFEGIGAILSTGLAEFPAQARWYGWAGLCFLAALYALNSWLQTAQRRYWLMLGQGYLSLAFVMVSLWLWISQTVTPGFMRLKQLQQAGAEVSLNLSTFELRNWAPIGHPNYVAGYLMLALPLFLGLAIAHRGWQRWLWGIALGLGLLDLYSTSSRAGWLGLAVLSAVAFGVLLVRSTIPRIWLTLGGAGIVAGLIATALVNDRLRSLLTAALNGQLSSDLIYRIITTTTGWRMGLNHWGVGAGPGSVPLLYQRYRPFWAGREVELAYQLHSTPIQIWAELGLWGMVAFLAAIALLTYLALQWLRLDASTAEASEITPRDRILVWSSFAGLLAYGVSSLTDYQLDNICISGLIVVFLAVLASASRQAIAPLISSRPTQFSIGNQGKRWATYAGIGLLIAFSLWLVPVHRAWSLSSQAFAALEQKDINRFAQTLSQAHQLAPWESYYSYQLGWNLGNLSLQVQDPQQRQVLTRSGIEGLQQGIQASPYQEFGHSNLAWLLSTQDASAMVQSFTQSAQLIPAKRGVFYGLGLGLLAQGQADLAVEAVTLEALRDPLLITSPLWQTANLQPLYGQMLTRIQAKCTDWLQQSPQPSWLNTYAHQIRGGTYWWQGNLAAAQADWSEHGSPLSQQILAISQGQTATNSPTVPTSAASPGAIAIAAWQNPTERPHLLQQAWFKATQTIPSDQFLQDLQASMARSTSLDQWLKQNAPTQQYRRTRAGFGVLSRHIDGTAPVDYLTVIENVPMTQFFAELLPSIPYVPQLDLALQPWRDSLLQAIAQANQPNAKTPFK